MKKLIIAAVSVAVGLVASASTVNWSLSDVSAKGTTTPQGYIAYLFDAEVGSDTISTAFAKKDLTLLSAALGTKGLTSAGKITTAQAKNAPYGENDFVTGFAVIFNSDSANTASYFMVGPEVTSAKAVSSAGTVTLTLGSHASASWTAMAPEPTSGLLLLIGMAGLALRRRRA